MTHYDTNPDSQGHYDYTHNDPPEGPDGVFSAEDEADWLARIDAANAYSVQFNALAAADTDYWPAVKMVRVTRLVLRDPDGARAWQAIVNRKRARFDALIREMSTDE